MNGMRLRALLILGLLSAGLACCSPQGSERAQCLAELARFQAEIGGRIASESVSSRIAVLAGIRRDALARQELAWVLVPALGLEYRLRRGDDPAQCQELFEGMGLMPVGSGPRPVSLGELRRLVNRAALPETELLLPGPRPLPGWLVEP